MTTFKVFGITPTSEIVEIEDVDSLDEAKLITKAKVDDYHYLFVRFIDWNKTGKIVHKRKGKLKRLYYQDSICNPVRVGDYLCYTSTDATVSIGQVTAGSLFNVNLGVYHSVDPTVCVKLHPDYANRVDEYGMVKTGYTYVEDVQKLKTERFRMAT